METEAEMEMIQRQNRKMIRIINDDENPEEETILYESDSWSTISEARCYLAQDKKSVRSELLLI